MAYVCPQFLVQMTKFWVQLTPRRRNVPPEKWNANLIHLGPLLVKIYL